MAFPTAWSRPPYQETSTYRQAVEAETRVLTKLPFFQPNEPLDYGSTLNSPVMDWSSFMTEPDSEPMLPKRSVYTRHNSVTTLVDEDASSPEFKKSIARVGGVDIGQGQFIRTLHISSVAPELDTISGMALGTLPAAPDEPPIVLTHGFGAGLAYYYRVYAGLAQQSNRAIYSVDWLGMGLSSRPDTARWFGSAGSTTEDPSGENEHTRRHRAEQFFVDALERWRTVVGLDRMVLVGHSFGGYISTLYALQYPQRVAKLILLSPMGFTEAPASFQAWAHHFHRGQVRGYPPAVELVPHRDNAPSTRKARSAPSSPTSPRPVVASRRYSELIRHIVQHLSHNRCANTADRRNHEYGRDGPACMTQSPEHQAEALDASVASDGDVLGSPYLWLQIYTMVWRWQLSPQWFIRNSSLVGALVYRRYIGKLDFPSTEDSRPQALTDYFYQLAVLPGSGEYAISLLLHPYDYSRAPLCRRVSHLQVPTLFVYGDRDWMDEQGALDAIRTMDPTVPTRLAQLKSAGHNLMLDNPTELAALILQALDE
ncbi:hypothetical protein H4R34_002636 [Dimargaris verticillata]|uniref:AB hydrolase-1 domain-containing protein n=1 Tax=Dimargaris verticillata TaxID=2761393 RepID=A0A9W8B656_9FUNG|nr:hypothetical protein H4R34_002636 [Dimargaris verticillata]